MPLSNKKKYIEIFINSRNFMENIVQCQKIRKTKLQVK